MKAVQEFVISDELWVRMQRVLPTHPPPPHPLGCHRQRVADRTILNGIFFVLRTGCQWKALSATGICSGSTAHRRFQEWVDAGVFARLWDEALREYDDVIGLDLEWLSLDGSLHKAPLGGKKNRAQPHGPGQGRRQAQPLGRGAGHSGGRRVGGGQPARHETDQQHVE